MPPTRRGADRMRAGRIRRAAANVLIRSLASRVVAVMKRTPPNLPALAAALALCLPAGTTLAHEYWLSPSRYDAAPRQVIAIGALAGEEFRGEWKPWSPAHAVRLVARTDRTVDLARGARPGGSPWVSFAPADTGGAMLAFESGWTPIELPAERFDAYLAEEGFAEPLATRRAAGTRTPGRERYRRCAKSWLAGSDPTRATTPIGMPLEIVPLATPGSGASLRVRVLQDGRPLAGAGVRAWRSALGADGMPRDPATREMSPVPTLVPTDDRGEALVPCAEPGEWLLNVVTMQPCPERDIADWQSTWSSLTFKRADAEASANR